MRICLSYLAKGVQRNGYGLTADHCYPTFLLEYIGALDSTIMSSVQYLRLQLCRLDNYVLRRLQLGRPDNYVQYRATFSGSKFKP